MKGRKKSKRKQEKGQSKRRKRMKKKINVYRCIDMCVYIYICIMGPPILLLGEAKE
jgi:hypothetical protein